MHNQRDDKQSRKEPDGRFNNSQDQGGQQSGGNQNGSGNNNDRGGNDNGGGMR